MNGRNQQYDGYSAMMSINHINDQDGALTVGAAVIHVSWL